MSRKMKEARDRAWLRDRRRKAEIFDRGHHAWAELQVAHDRWIRATVLHGFELPLTASQFDEAFGPPDDAGDEP